jgi:hypothetical protein
MSDGTANGHAPVCQTLRIAVSSVDYLFFICQMEPLMIMLLCVKRYAWRVHLIVCKVKTIELLSNIIQNRIQ